MAGGWAGIGGECRHVGGLLCAAHERRCAAHGTVRCLQRPAPAKPGGRSENRPALPSTHLDQQIIKLLQHQLPKGRACGRGWVGVSRVGRSAAAGRQQMCAGVDDLPSCSMRPFPTVPLSQLELHQGSSRQRTRLGRKLVAAVQAARLRHLRRRQAALRIGPIVRQHLRHGSATTGGDEQGPGAPRQARRGFAVRTATPDPPPPLSAQTHSPAWWLISVSSLPASLARGLLLGLRVALASSLAWMCSLNCSDAT